MNKELELVDVMEVEVIEEHEVFKTLNKIDVSQRVEKKKSGNTWLTYLSWAWAWAEVKKKYPEAQYNIHKYGQEEKPYLYDKDLGYMVTTDVTIDGLTHEMWLPVMNHSNKAMKDHEYTYDTKYTKNVKVEKASMFDINTTIMRCLVKNLAMHGLGLYIYAGEDLPEVPEEVEVQVEPTTKPKQLKKFTPPTDDQITELSYLLGDERVDKMLEFYKVKFITEIDQNTVKQLIEREQRTIGGSLDDL